MTVASLEVAAQHEVIIVDDLQLHAQELARILENHGFSVRLMQSGDAAVHYATETRVGVVLLDIRMPGNLDGIDAAREILRRHPFASVIFVTAHARESDYLERVKREDFRVAGWIEKPILNHLPELLALVQTESCKVDIRRAMDRAELAGVAPVDFLRSIGVWDSEFPADAIGQVLDELPSRISATDARVELLYEEIHRLTLQSVNLTEARGQIDRLLPELQRLLEGEADSAEDRFRAKLTLRPGTGTTALQNALRLLEG